MGINREQMWLNQMRSLLHHNVPRFIKHIKERGGVSNAEWEWLQHSEDTSTEHPEGILARADEYLLYPNSVEKFKKGLFILVKAIAILSFVSGGIYVFGLHFSPEIDEFVEDDGSSET